MDENHGFVVNDKGEISIIKSEIKNSVKGNENYFVYALDQDGEICSASSSEKGKEYFCPACGESVILRKGKIKIHHFAHRSNIEGICNHETVIHKISKLLIKKVVKDWIDKKGESPSIVRKCQGSLECYEKIIQKLPEKVDGVKLECRLENGKIADVVLLSGSEVVSAIEIRVSHEVEERNITNYVVPFIELDGKELIENPMVWKPLVDKYKKVVCCECSEGFIKFFDEASRIAKRDKITLPKDFYKYGIQICWKCKADILVFDWDQQEAYSKIKPSYEPMPETIQFRYSKTINTKYWVNTCPRCHSIQGEHYLKSEPDSPFWFCGSGDFKEVMYRIACNQGRWIKK